MTPISTKKILYAVLSGVMLTASFPPGRLDWLAWFSLVPLLKSLDKESPSRSFFLGFTAGLAHYLTLIYWIVVALRHYGGLNFLASFGAFLLLCLYLSVYPALFSSLICFVRGFRFGVFQMASLWVGLELIRAKALSGFPWSLLGYSQFRHISLIQVADVVGVYGISFLLVLSNGLIHCLLFDRRFTGKGGLKWEIIGFVIMAVFVLSYGQYHLSIENRGEEDQKSVKVAIIQGNIDQSVKWNPAYQEKTLHTYLRLSRSTSPYKPRLLVWPETSMPFFFQDNSRYARRLFGLSRRSGAALIFGSPAYGKKGGKTRYFNRVYLLSSSGKLAGYYDKVHLVPFGEYVPLKRFFPFIERVVPAAGDFASGDRVEPLAFSDFSAGALICFEIIFPELARTQARKGAEILVNLTNDAWFGMTSAPYQHLSMAVFRAVENRRPIIRAANTGISAFIGPEGKIMEQGGLFSEEVLKHEVKLAHSSLAFYTRHGDLFAFALLFISLIKTFLVLCYNTFWHPAGGAPK